MRRNRYIYYYPLLFASLFSIVGCSEDGLKGYSASTTLLFLKGNGIENHKLSFDDALRKKVEVVSNNEWKITGLASQDFFSIYEGDTIGRGNCVVEFKAEAPEVLAKEDSQVRTRTLYIESDDRKDSLILFQLSKDLLFDSTASVLDFEEDGGSGSIELLCNKGWKARFSPKDDKWCHLDSMHGNGSESLQTITIECAPNDTDKERSTDLIIFPEGYDKNGYRKVVSISQHPKSVLNALERDTVYFESNEVGSTMTFTVECNTGWNSKIVNSSNWFDYDTPKGEGDATITVRCRQMNTSLNPRKDIIQFTSTTGNKILNIPVIQRPKYSIEINSGVGTTVRISEESFEIKSSVKWKLTCPNSYFDLRIKEAKIIKSQDEGNTVWVGEGFATAEFVDVKNFTGSVQLTIESIDDRYKADPITINVINEL